MRFGAIILLIALIVALMLPVAAAGADDWRADVTLSGNRIDIRASRLGACRVLVHPDMVNLGENLVITLNGEVVHDALVEPDLEFMIENFLENRDRKLLYVTEIRVDIEVNPED